MYSSPKPPLPSRLPHNTEQRPVFYSRSLELIHFEHSYVYISIPNSLTLPPILSPGQPYWVKQVRDGEVSYDIPYMKEIKINDTNEVTKQKQTHTLREGTEDGCWVNFGICSVFLFQEGSASLRTEPAARGRSEPEPWSTGHQSKITGNWKGC